MHGWPTGRRHALDHEAVDRYRDKATSVPASLADEMAAPTDRERESPTLFKSLTPFKPHRLMQVLHGHPLPRPRSRSSRINVPKTTETRSYRHEYCMQHT